MTDIQNQSSPQSRSYSIPEPDSSVNDHSLSQPSKEVTSGEAEPYSTTATTNAGASNSNNSISNGLSKSLSADLTTNTLDNPLRHHSSAKCKMVASSKNLRVNAPSFNQASSSSNSHPNNGSIRETTPPSSLNTKNKNSDSGSPCAISSPATPISSNSFHLFGNGGPSSRSTIVTNIPTGSTLNATNSSSINHLSSLKNKNRDPIFQKNPASLDVDMLQDDCSAINITDTEHNDADNDCVMRDSNSASSSDDDMYVSSSSITAAAALFNIIPNTNNAASNGDYFTKAKSLKSNYNGFKPSLSSSNMNNIFDGSLPSTPSSAFFHTSQEPSSHNSNLGNSSMFTQTNGKGLTVSRRTVTNPESSLSSSRAGGAPASSDQPFPLAVHQILDAITPHISHYSDDDKITLLKEILSLTTRPVLSAIQEHISPLLKKDPFAYLPNEISLRIISFIDDPKTLARASQVSRLWYLILSDDLTWKELCKTHHYRRLSAAVGSTPNIPRGSFLVDNRAAEIGLGAANAGSSNTYRSSAIHGPNPETNNAIATGLNDFVESQYYPEAMKHTAPTNYRSHFKHQYMVNTAWQSGGRLAAKYVINHSGVVTSLIMTSKYIAFSLDSSKIFVFGEDGKLLRSLLGHTMGVWALNIWGDTLVSGGCDRDIRVWNIKTGECLQILRGHQSTIRCIQMVDSKTVISGSRDTSVRVWDIEKGRCLHVLNGHTSTVRCIEVKGDICVSGSYDCTAKVWRISDGTLLHTLYGHISQIYSLAFDGDRIVTGSLDAIIKVWDAHTGADLGILSGHTSLVSLLQLKGDTLASGGSDGTVRIWDLKNFKCVHRIAAHDNSVTSLQFDDYRIVSGGSDGRVKVWDRATGLLVRELSSPYNSVWRIEFKDEKLAILASRNQQVHFKLISFCPHKDSFDQKMKEIAKRRLNSLADDTDRRNQSDASTEDNNDEDEDYAIVDESIILGSGASASALLQQAAADTNSRLEQVSNSLLAGRPAAGSSAPQGLAIPMFATMAGPVPSHNGSRAVSRDNSRRSSFTSLSNIMSINGGDLSMLQTQRDAAGQPAHTGDAVPLLPESSTGNGGLNSPIFIPAFTQRGGPVARTVPSRSTSRAATAVAAEDEQMGQAEEPVAEAVAGTSTPVSNITSTPTNPPPHNGGLHFDRGRSS